jgi:hypothetical protein
MTDLRTAIDVHHQAVVDFLAAARAVEPGRWHEPRAPDKWAPGQIAEHVTLAYEVNRGVLHGVAPGKVVPRFLRPVIRELLLRPVLRRGRFIPGSKSPRVFRPGPAPASQAALLGRLQTAAEAFEKAASNLGASAIDHPVFGRLPLVDFIRLQEIHTNHHRAQMPTARP